MPNKNVKHSQIAGINAPGQFTLNPTQIGQAVGAVGQSDENLARITDDYVSQLTQIGASIVQSVPVASSQPNMAVSQQIPADLTKLKTSTNMAQALVGKTLNELQAAIDAAMVQNQKMLEVNNTIGNPVVNNGQGIQNTASNKSFNFKKYSQFLDTPQQNMGISSPQSMQPEVGMEVQFGPFSHPGQLADALNKLGKKEEQGGMGRADVENKLINSLGDTPDDELDKEKLRKAMEVFFEYGLNNGGMQQDDASPEQLKVAEQIWDFLPSYLKQQDNNDVVGVERVINNNQENTMANIEDIKKRVEASNEEIKKLAQKDKPKNSTYNFKKEAQHKALENVMLWGPEDRQIDAFTGEPVSDYHIMERNKGWGFRIGDRWDIDFESFWRGNIMDKYHRPYRDEEGNWVGGYIEKRFEVDRWQPEENKYMLKPGEKRKPRPAELGNMEARLEAYRGNKDKVFNWAEAISKKTVKTSQTMGGDFEPVSYGDYKAEKEEETNRLEDQHNKEVPSGVKQIGQNEWEYGDFQISLSSNPFEKEYQYVHKDYDGPGDNRGGHAKNLHGVVDAIHDWYEQEAAGENVNFHESDPYDGTTAKEQYKRDWEQKFGPGGLGRNASTETSPGASFKKKR